MTDLIGKRIDALQGRIAGLQSRLETAQRELNEVTLEYVRNDEIQRCETARANADNLVVDAVGEVPPVDLPVADRGHCCLDLECYQASTYPATGHCDCLGGELFPPCHREEQGRIGRKEWGGMTLTCTYCGEVVSGSPEALADPLLDHWKEQCKAHPVYGGRNQQANSEQTVSKPWQFSVQLCSECYSKHREPRGATYSSRGTRCTNCGAEIHIIYWARTCWPVEGVAEDAIARVRELADTWMSDGAAWGPYSARCILDALDGGAE